MNEGTRVINLLLTLLTGVKTCPNPTLDPILPCWNHLGVVKGWFPCVKKKNLAYDMQGQNSSLVRSTRKTHAQDLNCNHQICFQKSGRLEGGCERRGSLFVCLFLFL